MQSSKTSNQYCRNLELSDGVNALTTSTSAANCTILPANPRTRTQVVVIGAGLAGLAAAHRLYESGINDVIILDALDRIGGRVHTINYSDYLLELGAQWLHGADQNPLYKWLIEKNMLDDFEDASLGFKGLFCTNDAKQIDPKLVAKVLDIVCESKLSLSKNRYVDIISNKGFKNAGEVFRHQLDERIANDETLRENKELVDAIFQWFLRYETIENCCDSMDEVSIASYTDWTDWGDGTLLNFKQGYRSLLNWFCSQFPARKWIHLNRQVLNVEMLTQHTGGGPMGGICWMDQEDNQYSSPMLVRFAESGSQQHFASNTNGTNTSIDGSHQVLEQPSTIDCQKSAGVGLIECDHVIVTVSLGFLKKNHETFFRPQLAEPKKELIRSIGFGTVNKIVLHFETPFWRNGMGFKLVWKKQSNDQLQQVDKDYPVWVRDLIAFDVVRKQPNLLIGWIGGLGARLMEMDSDEQVGQICLRLMARFLPDWHPKPSKLIACICSRWNSNPFICGSYSFQSMRSFDLKLDKLHEPIYNTSSSPTCSGSEYNAQQQPNGAGVKCALCNGLGTCMTMNNNITATTNNNHNNNNNNNNGYVNKLGSSSAARIPRILFAGEATAGKLYSTTHGAIITGWREADRLTDHLVNAKRVNNNQVNVQQPVGQLQSSC